MTHPDELLAEYVEGGLDPSTRAEVEGHLASCGVCRAEVAEATSARQTLLALPEVEPPRGIPMAVLREARDRSPSPRWAAPLKVAAALVLLAGAVGGALYVFGQEQTGEGESTAADGAGEQAPRQEEDADAASPEAAEEGRAAALQAAYPVVRRTGTEHDQDSILVLASDLRDEARTALDAGFPSDAFAFYEANPVDSFSPAARDALVCAGQGLEPERSVVPFVIEEAAWASEPAWVVSYLQGPEPSARYDSLRIIVVGREACGVLHYAQQRL